MDKNYKTSCETKVLHLKNHLYSLRMPTSDSIIGHITIHKNTRDQVIIVGENLESKNIVSITFKIYLGIKHLNLSIGVMPLKFDKVRGSVL